MGEPIPAAVSGAAGGLQRVIGGALLADAASRIVAATDIVAARFVVVDAIDEHAAAEADRLLASWRGDERPEVIDTKSSPTDVVTEMDRRSEVLITDRIRAARPGDTVLGEEGGQQHEEPRRAEATLERVLRHEGLLQRSETVRGAEALDGLDGAPLGLHGKHQAGTRRQAVNENRAGTADSMLAADVCPGEAEVVAEDVGESMARLGGDGL